MQFIKFFPNIHIFYFTTMFSKKINTYTNNKIFINPIRSND